jgi:DNA primase
MSPKENKSSWVDFLAIKQNVSFLTILEHYNLLADFKTRDDKLTGPCPIHKGDSKTAFHIDLQKNAYHCFTRCKAMGFKGGGNIIDFVAEVERTGTRPQDIRKAAQLILDWTGNGQTGERQEKETPKKRKPGTKKNSPLTFQLQLDPDHPYFEKRGLTKETMEHFGLGYAHKGIMKGRICIPLHDHKGNLVAYAGRALEEKLAEEEGKYKFPANFLKSLVLFNFHRIKEFKTLILVEGFFDCFKIHQAGYPNVCALMGTAMSDFHEKLIIAHFKSIIIMLDDDPAGKECTKDILNRLYDKVFIRTVKFDTFGKSQPDLLEDKEILQMLSFVD